MSESSRTELDDLSASGAAANRKRGCKYSALGYMNCDICLITFRS